MSRLTDFIPQAALIPIEGNIGIGTNNPQNFGSGFRTLQLNSSGSGATGGAVFVAQDSAGVEGRFQTFNGTVALNAVGATIPLTFTTNSTERMRIDSLGNVGVGIDNTTSRFHIYNPDNSTYAPRTLTVETSSNRPQTFLRLVNTGSNLPATFAIGLASANGEYMNTAISRDFIIRSEAGFLGVVGLSGIKFGGGISNFPERMRINSSGNVGIGTTDPQVTLEVNSSLPDEGTNHPNRAGIITRSEGTSIGSRVGVHAASDTVSPLFLTMRSRGSLAVPTAVQQNDILGNYIGVAYNGSSWPLTGGVRIYASNNWTTTNTTWNSYLSLTTSTEGSETEKVRIDSSGRVGIGLIPSTEIAASSLHVLRNVRISHTTGSPSATTNIDVGADNQVAGGIGYVYASTGRKLYLGANSQERLIIDSNGNIGIGTASPGHTLHVNGPVFSNNTPKAWCCFTARNNGVAGQIGIRNDYNILLITRISTGRYLATFETNLPDRNYTFIGSVAEAGTPLAVQVGLECASSTGNVDFPSLNPAPNNTASNTSYKTTNGVKFVCGTASAGQDSTELYFIIV